MVTFDEEKQKKRLESLREKEEEELTQMLSQKYGIPYANLEQMPVDLDYLKLIPEEKAREGKIAVFQGVGKKLQVGIKNPELSLTQNLIKELEKEGYEIQQFLVSTNSLEKTWAKYKEVPKFEELSKGAIDISPERIKEFLSQTDTLRKLKETFLERISEQKNRRISDLLEIILSGALSADASDVHLEAREDKVEIRYRLDGVLHDILEFNHKAYQLLLSRIKLISGMKLNIREKAQDGRFSIKTEDAEIEVRVSALPGPYGESLVLRILNPKNIAVAFKDLGINKRLEEIIRKEINKPNGMILTTGPTGSGKTTTLYAFLKEVNSPDIKIITVEEPIEYHLEGLTQTQTNPQKGYDFSTALRSILRQDPDIIMVGEIRDKEAANIALNAALTGHLVFSSLHTNDAAGTIPRLIELGANPNIIAPSVNFSIAQRLTRKVCEKCKKEYTPNEEEKQIIEKIINSLPNNTPKPNTKNLKLFKPEGCEACNGIGYKGRVGIFEGILIDEEMEKLILKNPSESEIKETSKKQQIMNMAQDAVIKVVEGTTTLEEVKRVVEIN
ncbi:MAG: hypothetical protein COT67_02940 [Candidatus Tagabacteria bacterium CG09_land_8_20_14_0_10_41_14]|uniref:Bacterial type II secretion system protein E domain-containing protein n=2 Tax=Candidatus Tagaibacteriota TaxID=1817918 RepID=A0A2H0WKL0_9BACT|nr:MAG: hypothetical protein COT67_02940 [Candidatus Tagabacteria bacterium CG09_land_8_20_14_0_10_41_14]PJE73300.1 MAG: hypothetical protein COV00_00590 [Candidatus Tagabacteria bacterium CG10_big_fil_rev_8_21_14_0_10_40_13]